MATKLFGASRLCGGSSRAETRVRELSKHRLILEATNAHLQLGDGFLFSVVLCRNDNGCAKSAIIQSGLLSCIS